MESNRKKFLPDLKIKLKVFYEFLNEARNFLKINNKVLQSD